MSGPRGSTAARLRWAIAHGRSVAGGEGAFETIGNLATAAAPYVLPVAAGAGLGILGSTLFGGGGNVQVQPPPPPPTAPAMSPEQQKLIALQLKGLESDLATQQAQINSPEQAKQIAEYLQNLSLVSDTLQAGLKAEIPLPVAVQMQKEKETQELMAMGLKQWGPGFMGSSGFQELLQRFNQTWAAREDEFRRGLRQEAVQVLPGLSPTFTQANVMPAKFLSSAFGMTPQAGPLSASLQNQQQIAANYGLAGYKGALDFNSLVNELNYKTAIAEQQGKSALLSSGIGALGTLGAGYLTSKKPAQQTIYHFAGQPAYGAVGAGV